MSKKIAISSARQLQHGQPSGHQDRGILCTPYMLSMGSSICRATRMPELATSACDRRHAYSSGQSETRLWHEVAEDATAATSATNEKSTPRAQTPSVVQPVVLPPVLPPTLGKIPNFSQLRGAGVSGLPLRGLGNRRSERASRAEPGRSRSRGSASRSQGWQPEGKREKTQKSERRSDLGADSAIRRAVRTSPVASESLAQIRIRISPAARKSIPGQKGPGFAPRGVKNHTFRGKQVLLSEEIRR